LDDDCNIKAGLIPVQPRKHPVDYGHSLVTTQSALKPQLKPQWLQIWHLTSRNLSNANVSRSAAHLLNTVLSSDILPKNDLSALIDTTLFSNGLNGPVGLSDAALSLWSTIIELHSASGRSVAQQTVTRLVNWLSSHYALSLSLKPFLFLMLNELQPLLSITLTRNSLLIMQHLQLF
jgi:hypothetical protein